MRLQVAIITSPFSPSDARISSMAFRISSFVNEKHERTSTGAVVWSIPVIAIIVILQLLVSL